MGIDDVNTVLRDHESRLPFDPVEAAAERIMDLGGIASSSYTAEEAIRSFQRELERQTGGQLVVVPADKISLLQGMNAEAIKRWLMNQVAKQPVAA